MSNYLPVLLVSVAANSIPDDSALSTLPRGQVDYLSHNWEEEDVWRSWRNMTRQKNEITNGVRLENASWRTWWKQRNGLGTVTPETLNWLKDSDVTWLYGPLHTAVDWAPPPKPSPDTATRTSALDLSTTHKPILKHRSISQLLTSDLPTSPIFTPTESEDDESVDRTQLYPSEPPSEDASQQRPTLTHTKSDTHITRWGPSRLLRKDSPPRIDPPVGLHGVASSGEGGYSSTILHALSSSSTSNSDSFPATSNHSKKKHISFNTFVEQCIAIEKPKKSSVDGDNDDEDDISGSSGTAQQSQYGSKNVWGYDDGYEEDEEGDSNDEDESLSMWDERFGGSALAGSDSDSDGEGAVEDEEYDDEEDDSMAMRSSIHHRPRNNFRSQSSASSSSASTSTSTDTSPPCYQGSPRRNRSPSSAASQRRFSSSTARPHVRLPPACPPPRRRRRAPPLIRTPATTSNSDHHPHGSPPPIQSTHVTIAPIAPTILKTGGYAYGGSEWVEGFGDEGSDDGILGPGRWWGPGVDKGMRDSLRDDERNTGGEDEGTPVELVYVPPLGSNYSIRGQEGAFGRVRKRQDVVDVMEDHEDGLGHGEQSVYRRRHRLFSVGVAGDDEADADIEGEVDVAVGGRTSSPRTSPLPVPTLVVGPGTGSVDGSVRGKDAYDYFGGPDLGEDFPARRRNVPLRGRRGSEGDRGRPVFTDVSSSVFLGDMERSRSISRTPSPAVVSSSGNPVSSTRETQAALGSPNLPPAPSPSAPALLRRSSSASPPHTQAPVPPPPRGRGSSSHQDLQVHTRGRSSTRTASSILDREGIGSPLGSYSPDGVVLASVGVAYAGGRIEREREKRVIGDRDRDREQSRGRDRTGKRLSHSLSPDDPPLVPSAAVSPATSPVVASPPSAASSPSPASPQSNFTAIPVDQAPTIPALAVDDRRAEEKQRTLTPTPLNSPIVSMQSVPVAIAAAASKHTSPKGRSPPLTVPPPHPVEPSTSYSISPPREHCVPASPSSPKSPRGPTSPTRGDGTIVGKAVEMVSSAGVFLGLWHHGGTDINGAGA